MIEVGVAEEYDAEVAGAMGRLLQDLSATANGEAPTREIIEEIIESPWHDLLLAFDENELVAMASVSIVMGAKVQRVEYLEELVVRSDRQRQGIGTKMWEAIVAWGRKKGCRRLEFTSSDSGKKQGAATFYERCGAKRRETNNFRFEL